jgi:hypothetical protein
VAQRFLAALAALAAIAFAAPVSADPAPATPPAQTSAPPDVAGAVALLKLFNSATANPRSETNHASLVISLPDSTRTQMVCVSGATYTSQGMNVREVYAYVEKFSGDLDGALATRLLRESEALLPGGAWAVVKSEGGGMIIFESYVAVDADAATVQSVVSRVAATADKLELELTSKDDW